MYKELTELTAVSTSVTIFVVLVTATALIMYIWQKME